MPTITLTLPVAGQNILAGLHSTNYANLQALLNGGLDNTNIAAAGDIQGSKIRQSYGTTPPVSPSTGDIWVFPFDATNGVNWIFRYNSGSASTYKWEFVGGPPTYSEITAANTTTVTPGWTNLSVVGPQVQVPRAGDYWCWGAANMFHSSGAGAFLGVAINDGTPPTPEALATLDGASIGRWLSVPGVRLNGMAANDFARLRYAQQGPGTLSAQFRSVHVTPIRVS